MVEYIERDAAIRAALSCTDSFEPIEVDITVESVVSKLRKLPIADVQSVKHGEWLDLWIEDDEMTDGGFMVNQCSVCKDEMYYGRPNYCPNCGAKMDGDENS